MAGGIRNLAREALALHNAGKHEDALCSANALSLANPDSALAHNLVGVLHFSAGGAARDERVLRRGDEPPSVPESSHFGSALGAFSAAARAAPNCVLTGVAHAEALNAEQRFAEAQAELLRVLLKKSNHPDPAITNVGYDLFDASGANVRRVESLRQALVLLEETTATINMEIVPGEAAKMLNGDAPVDQLREPAKVLSETYPYAVGAMLLRVHIELEQVRALGQGDDRRPLLRRSLALLSHAAGNFDSSLLIALFHAKVLFALDEFGESETECRRALRIEDPTDPGFEDIPPAISVPGADYDARVASVRRQLHILLKQIVVLAAVCWSSMKSTHQSDIAAMVHKVTSVNPDTMIYEHFNRIDLPAAKTISEAVHFLKTKKSWSFFICPDINCDSKKFVSTGLLWEHLQSEHQGEPWNELESVLGPDLNEYTSEDDPSLDGITFSSNSIYHMIFHLPVQKVFESLLLSPSVGIKAEPLVEMRQRKCRDGIVILEDIKEKLKMVPQDEHSSEFEEFRLAIKNLWLKFLETASLDYREVILPLARSFQWIQIKKLIDFSAKDLGRFIGGASIDSVFGKVPAAPDRDVSVKHGSKPSHVSRATVTDAELEVKGTSGQPVKKIASTSSCQQSLNVFNKNNADKDLSILSLIIRSFCSLEHFRDKFLTEPLAWIPSADNICIAQQFYEIFVSWEKNDHHLTDAVLTSMKTLLSRVNGTHFTEKLQVGTTFTSEIVSTILIGLHMSETCSSFSLKETGRHVVNPNTCGDCICPTHSLFGIKFDASVSCKCGERSVEYTTLFHKLAAGSPQTTKIKSFIELPVLSDEQFCKGNPCEECGELLNIDLFLSNIPHFFTIVLNWLGGSESQDTLSEVLASMTSPLDIKFFCKSAHSAARYTIKSMICYADDRYVCFARNEDKWLIYDFETVETEDTWEHLLERFKDCKLQPEVLFFEVIK